jgi:hypothetical protein
MKKINQKNMLKLIIFGVIASLFVVFVNAAQSTQRPASSYDIVVTLINQEPDPAESGRFVDVRFKFDNNGSDEARNVEVEILPEYPFSLNPGRDSVSSIGTLQTRQEGDVGVIVKYRLRVDKDAVDGENELKIRYRIDKGVWVQPEEFFVAVQTHDAILAVESIYVDKKTLEPGTSNTVKAKLSNQADSILKDVRVRLELGGLPFVPLGSTNEKNIYKIDPKGSYEFSFNLLADPEAESGAYQVPITITYLDDLGKGYFVNSTMGLIIGAKPDLSITLDDSEIYQKGSSGDVVVKVVNKGVIGIKFTNMKLIATDDYRTLSADEVYLGNIDSDDFETAEFKLFVEKYNKESVRLPLVLEYKDANNNNYKDQINLELSLYSASEAKKFGLEEGDGFVGTLIVIIIVVGGVYYYRKRIRKKK